MYMYISEKGERSLSPALVDKPGFESPILQHDFTKDRTQT